MAKTKSMHCPDEQKTVAVVIVVRSRVMMNLRNI